MKVWGDQVTYQPRNFCYRKKADEETSHTSNTSRASSTSNASGPSNASQTGSSSSASSKDTEPAARADRTVEEAGAVADRVPPLGADGDAQMVRSCIPGLRGLPKPLEFLGVLRLEGLDENEVEHLPAVKVSCRLHSQGASLQHLAL